MFARFWRWVRSLFDPARPDDDELDGLCDENIQPDPIPDGDVDGIVLYADLAGTDSLEEIAARKAEWQELFDAS